MLVQSVWVFPHQRYGLWDQEGPLEEKNTEEKKKKADEVIEDKTAAPQTETNTETLTEPEETQNAGITPEPEEPKKKGGLLRFRKKKSSDKGNLKEKTSEMLLMTFLRGEENCVDVILGCFVVLTHFEVVCYFIRNIM